MKTPKPKAKRPTRAALARKVMELEGQLAHVYHFVDADLHKAGSGLLGSGVLITMHALGGNELVKPFVIRDGLSAETISAIRSDIERSYTLATTFKPKGLK